MYSPVKYIYIYRQMVDICVCVYIRYCLYIWVRWVIEIMKIWQIIYFDCIYCQNFSMKIKFILGFLFIMITLVSLHNIHVLNYKRNIFLKITFQTLENILKLIFKVVTKHWKMRQFSRKCSLENEQFSKKC